VEIQEGELIMGLHDQYYGKGAEPANNNEPVPFVSPAHVQMHAGIAEMRERLGMPEESMQADGYEHFASAPRIRPARNYRDEASDEN
jgi:hypothetical protein